MKTLELNNISKTYVTEIGELEVLKDINFSVNKGEIIAIVGPSGSGKSTLLNIISGLIKPTTGNIVINGDIGYMFQHDHLFNWRTVWKNILIGLEIKKNYKIEDENRLKNLLKKYGLLDFMNHYPQELSGGMRQRIALIRTLATNPNILLLDEPFSALDYQTRIDVSNDIYKILKEENVASILVTHDISEAISLADKIIVLSHRPAYMKKIIDVEIEKDLTPLEKRKTKEFPMYFDLIWGLLNEK